MQATAIINAYKRVKAIKSENPTVIIIVTDGYDNCFQVDLGGVQVDFTGDHLINGCTQGTSEVIADYFEQENFKLCIVALAVMPKRWSKRSAQSQTPTGRGWTQLRTSNR